MKRILLLSLLLLPIVALAQYPTFSNKQKLGVQTTGDGLIFRGNSNPNYNPSNINNAYFHLDTTTSKLYLYSVGTWQQVYPTPQFDTTTLNVYLKISDTTAMLLPYFRDSDTTSLNLINRFALKLNISDTVTMLTPYLRKADTISLSNRINLKLNISDTTILSNRITTNANNIITINNKLATKLDTIYTKFKNVVKMIVNKDTINIGSSLTDGYAINIIGDSVNVDTTLLDIRYPDRDSTNELQDITFATTAGIVTISGGKIINLDTLYNSVIDSVNLLIRDSIAAFTPLTEGYGINIIGDSINVDTSIIFNQSDTITLSNRINLKLNKSDTISLSNRINTKLDTIYVNYQTSIDTIVNKDTINITTLEAGTGINITNSIISLDTVLLDNVIRVQNIYVKNDENNTLLKGEAVYVTGANGTNILVKRASNISEPTSSKTLGIVMASIASKEKGYVIKEGLLEGLNTSAADSAGVPIWLGVNGALIYGLNNKPYAPNHLVYLGVVTRKHQNNGEIYVTVQNGFEIKELHDVQISDPVNKASLYYNSSQSLWRDTIAALLVSDTASMLSKYLRLSGGTLTGALNGTSLNFSSGAVFNENANNSDFRVESVGRPNMLFVDAYNNRVGIGTNSPQAMLEVDGTLEIRDSATFYRGAKFLKSNPNTRFLIEGTNKTMFYGNLNEDKIGIGTTLPTKTLDVNGTLNVTDSVTFGNTLSVTEKLLVNTNISDAVKISSNTNSTNLELANNSGNSVFIKSSNRNMVLQTDTTALMYLNGENNKVGILTMTPEQALEVAGTIRVDSLANNLIPVKLVGGSNSNDLTNVELGTGLSFVNDTLKITDNIINSGDTATLLRQDFIPLTSNQVIWTQGNKKLLKYFTQVYRNGQLLKDVQYTISSDSIVTIEEGSYKLGDIITVIAIDNIVALAGSGSMITLQGNISGSGTDNINTTINNGVVTNSMLAGSISDSKLNTITTAGKISNSATTATSANTNSTIVTRDNSGNFSAGTITASLNGNASTATNAATVTNVLPSNFASQTANTVLAAPNGSNGTPTFRSLISSDIPSLNYLPLTGGTVTGNTNFVPTTGRVIFGSSSQTWDEILGVNPRSTTSLGLGVYSNSSYYSGSLFRAQAENSIGSSYMLYEGRSTGGLPAFWVKGDGSSYFEKNITIGSEVNNDALDVHHDGDHGIRMSYLTAPSAYNFSIKPKVTAANVRYVFSQTNNNTFYDSILVFNQGNIGINKLNPSYKLDVNGTFNSTGNITEGGLNVLTSGDTTSMLTNYLRTGTAASTYQTILINPVTGTGTINYIPKFTASNTLGNANLFTNGNRFVQNEGEDLSFGWDYMGNTSSPFLGNNVKAGSVNETIQRVASTTYFNPAAIIFGFQRVNNSSGATSLGGINFMTTSGNPSGDINPIDSSRMFIEPRGNIGIGTMQPSYKFDIRGTLGVTGATTLGSTLAVAGNITEGDNNVLTNLDTASLSTRIDAINSGGNQIANNNNSTQTISNLSGLSNYYLWINNPNTVTITLPSPSANNNKMITIKNTGAGAVFSASSNVQPLANPTPPATLVNLNVILASGGGKWTTIISNGFEWVKMAGN